MDPGRSWHCSDIKNNFLLMTKDTTEDVALELCLTGDKSGLVEECDLSEEGGRAAACLGQTPWGQT